MRKISKIGIVNWPLEDDGNDLEKALEDPLLAKALKEFLSKQKDLEVFERRNNIAATSKGFYGAFYFDQLEKENK